NEQDVVERQPVARELAVELDEAFQLRLVEIQTLHPSNLPKVPDGSVDLRPDRPAISDRRNAERVDLRAAPQAAPQVDTGSGSRTSTAFCSRHGSRGSKRPAPTSSVEAAPAATAARSESSSGRSAVRAARKAASSTSPAPTPETGSTCGATARSRRRFRSSRKSAKLRVSDVINTFRAPISAIRSTAIRQSSSSPPSSPPSRPPSPR